MEYFLLQHQYNSKILFSNISKNFNIDIKKLNKFYPKKLNKNQITMIKNLKKNNIYGDFDGDIVKTNYFKDINGDNYIVINTNKPKYNNIYDAIKL